MAMDFKYNEKLKNYIKKVGAIINEKDVSLFKVQQEIDDEMYSAKVSINSKSLLISDIIRLETYDDDNEVLGFSIREVPVEDETFAIDFYCQLYQDSKIETLQDVQTWFDRLGFMIEISEQKNSYIVSVDNKIFFEITKEELEQHLLYQKHNLQNAVLGIIFSKLLYHKDEIARMPIKD